MASEHTAKAFDSDLQELTRLVAEMGGLVERMITESVDALIRRDVALGKRVVAADIEIDNLQRVIEERAVLTIARRQPMAIDLREIVSAMRVATDLERIGDLAKNVAKRVVAISDQAPAQKISRGIDDRLQRLARGDAHDVAGNRRIGRGHHPLEHLRIAAVTLAELRADEPGFDDGDAGHEMR